MKILLPESLKSWVEKQAESTLFETPSEYVSDLVSRDRERAERLAEMQASIAEGLESGISPLDAKAVRDEARKSLAE